MITGKKIQKNNIECKLTDHKNKTTTNNKVTDQMVKKKAEEKKTIADNQNSQAAIERVAKSMRQSKGSQENIKQNINKTAISKKQEEKERMRKDEKIAGEQNAKR